MCAQGKVPIFWVEGSQALLTALSLATDDWIAAASGLVGARGWRHVGLAVGDASTAVVVGAGDT